VPKAAEIVGLYMAPPTHAVVLSVDEKPFIQALERAQGHLKLPNGRAMIGQSHDHKRHGTSTLFAALNVGTGHIVGKHYKRRRRVEFRDFMNRVVKQYEGKEIHVILDNLSTHKPKRDLWLARHPNVHPLHADPYVMAEPDRNLVLDPGKPIVERGLVRQRRRTGGSHRKLHHQLQRQRPPTCLDQKRRPLKAPQAMFRGLATLGTSDRRGRQPPFARDA
jgi:DDE superfamily endonuclease